MKQRQHDVALPVAHDPRMVKLWMDGAEAPQEVIFDTQAEATHFAHSMYRLRTALTRAHHASSPKARQARITKAPTNTHPEDQRWKVVIYPIVSKFDKELKAAGLNNQDPPDLA